MVDFDCDIRCVRKAFNLTLFVTSSIGPRDFRRGETWMRLLFPILDGYDGIDDSFLVLPAAYVSRNTPHKYIKERGASGSKRKQDLEEA